LETTNSGFPCAFAIFWLCSSTWRTVIPKGARNSFKLVPGCIDLEVRIIARHRSPGTECNQECSGVRAKARPCVCFLWEATPEFPAWPQPMQESHCGPQWLRVAQASSDQAKFEAQRLSLAGSSKLGRPKGIYSQDDARDTHRRWVQEKLS
jgi:hypothetical protein